MPYFIAKLGPDGPVPLRKLYSERPDALREAFRLNFAAGPLESFKVYDSTKPVGRGIWESEA